MRLIILKTRRKIKNKMSFQKPILRATLGLQATALAARALKLVPKKKSEFKVKGSGKKLVKGFTDIMVGVGILKPTAGIVASQ